MTDQPPKPTRIYEYWVRRNQLLLQGHRFLRPEPTFGIMLLYDLKFEAAARMNGEIAEVELSEGALVCLLMFFAAALSHPQCFRDIGDPSLETEDQPEFSELSAHWGDLLVNRWRETTDVPLPKCPVRRAYVMHLTEIALDNVVHHELVHVFHGHAGLLQDIESKGLPALTETERRTLEWDADVCGVAWALGLQLELVRRQLANPGIAITLCGSPVAAVRDVVIAMSTVLVLQQACIRLRTQDPPHLMVRERGAAMLNQLAERASGWKIEEQEAARDLVVRASASVEKAYRYVTGREPDIDSVLEGARSVAEYTPVLLETWANLAPRLEPFAYVKLPPVQPPPYG